MDWTHAHGEDQLNVGPAGEVGVEDWSQDRTRKGDAILGFELKLQNTQAFMNG